MARPRIRRFDALRELIDLVVLIGAIYALVNLATVRFVVQGPSMEPTFEDNQFLIVSRIHYLFGDPQRGDVIVFHNPDEPSEDYIKRVIGIPGDTITFEDTRVLVNGVMIDEPYTNGDCLRTQCPDLDEPVVLGADEYYVMGDNRNRSRDSREIGVIQRQQIVGRVLIRYWPPTDWGIIAGADYD